MAKCKDCKRTIEWVPYQKDGKTRYRPIDPGKDSHDCPDTLVETEPIEPIGKEADKNPQTNIFSPGKIRILKIQKIIFNFETNDLLLTVEEFE